VASKVEEMSQKSEGGLDLEWHMSTLMFLTCKITTFQMADPSCTQCPYKGTKAMTEAHVLKYHRKKEDVPYWCPHCSTAFKGTSLAGKHMAKHDQMTMSDFEGTKKNFVLYENEAKALSREDSINYYAKHAKQHGKTGSPAAPKALGLFKNITPAKTLTLLQDLVKSLSNSTLEEDLAMSDSGESDVLQLHAIDDGFLSDESSPALNPVVLLSPLKERFDDNRKKRKHQKRSGDDECPIPEDQQKENRPEQQNSDDETSDRPKSKQQKRSSDAEGQTSEEQQKLKKKKTEDETSDKPKSKQQKRSLDAEGQTSDEQQKLKKKTDDETPDRQKSKQQKRSSDAEGPIADEQLKQKSGEHSLKKRKWGDDSLNRQDLEPQSQPTPLCEEPQPKSTHSDASQPQSKPQTSRTSSSGSPTGSDLSIDVNTLSQVVRTTVDAVSSSIVAAAKFTPTPPSHDVSILAAELHSTNNSLNQIAASLDSLATSHREEARARRTQTDLMVELKNSLMTISHMTKEERDMKRALKDSIDALTSTMRAEVNTNRSLIRTFIDGQRALTNQMNLQANTFSRFTERLKGLVEDDLRGGQTTNLVRKIIGLEEPVTDNHRATQRSPDRGFDQQIREIRRQNPPSKKTF